MAAICVDQTTIQQIALPSHAQYCDGLDDASLPPAQLRSIQILQKAIQGAAGDPLFGRLVAYVMHGILEDFKPRKLLSKSGETRGVILPLSAAEQRDGVTVCFADADRRVIHVCDVGVQQPQHPDRPRPSPALWTKLTTEKVSEALKYEGLSSLLCPKRSSLQIWQRRDTDLHTLLDNPRMEYILNTELIERLLHSFAWAKDMGIGGPGAEWLNQREPKGKLFRGLMKLARDRMKMDLDCLIEPIVPHIYGLLWESPQCYTGDIKQASKPVCTLAQTRRARWFASFPLYRSLANDKSALKLLDNDQQTVANISKLAGVPQAHTRRVREWPASMLIKAGVPDPLVFTELLARVDVNHLPQYKKVSGKEIDALASAVSRVNELVLPSHDAPLAFSIAQNLLKNAAGKWLEQAAFYAIDDAKHSTDFIQVFSRRTVLAALLKLEPVAKAVTCTDISLPEEIAQAKQALERVESISTKLLLAGLSGRWSLGNILQSSRSWHDQVGANGFTGILQIWPALCTPLEAPNGVQLIPLTTSAELAEEGKLMSHCVGGYVPQCRSGRSHIFSIRDPDGKRLSTLQLHQEQNWVKVVQNLSFANKQPEERASEAAQWLVEQANSGELKIDWNLLLAEQMRSRRNTGVSQILGFDPHDKALWNKAFSEFKSYCRGPLRATSVEDFVKASVQEIKRQKLPLDTVEARLLMLLENECNKS